MTPQNHRSSTEAQRGEKDFSVSLWLSVSLWCVLCSGCATAPMSASLPRTQAIPQLQGSYYQVGPGETLWRIAQSYGLRPQTLAAANRLPNAAALKVGQRLFIPLPPESRQFVWPVRGSARSAGATQGVEIAAPDGSLVRASRGGRVAVAAHELSGWGKAVLLDHLDGYLSVYAGLEQILVSPGTSLRQGTPLGSLGPRPLHFEIRYGAIPKHTLAMLPEE